MQYAKNHLQNEFLLTTKMNENIKKLDLIGSFGKKYEKIFNIKDPTLLWKLDFGKKQSNYT